MGVQLPVLTQQEVDELVKEFVFYLVYCGVEEKQDLNEEQQVEYEKWVKELK